VIELIERSDCPFCWKVRLALAATNTAYESAPVRFGEKHAKVLEHNPKKAVPVMIDGDVILWESTVMLEYIDEMYGEGSLYRGNPAQRARVRSLVAYSDGVIGPALRDLVFERRSKPPERQDPEVIRRGMESWSRVKRELEGFLGERQHFGEGFSAADCALLARIGVAQAYDAGPGGDLPRLSAWFARMQRTPLWRRAYPAFFIRPEH